MKGVLVNEQSNRRKDAISKYHSKISACGARTWNTKPSRIGQVAWMYGVIVGIYLPAERHKPLIVVGGSSCAPSPIHPLFLVLAGLRSLEFIELALPFLVTTRRGCNRGTIGRGLDQLRPEPNEARAILRLGRLAVNEADTSTGARRFRVKQICTNEPKRFGRKGHPRAAD